MNSKRKEETKPHLPRISHDLFFNFISSEIHGNTSRI